MKALVNYKIDKQGKKHVITARALHITDNIDFEIVEVSDYADMNKLIYDDNNKILEDKEKLKLLKQTEELAQMLVNKEFELLTKGDA